MQIGPDDWLAEQLGRAVFKVVVEAGAVDRAALLAHSQGQRRALYYAKVPTLAVGTVAALTGVGFGVIDVSVTFDRWADGRDDLPVAGPVAVQPAEPAHFPALLDIAQSCFVYSRFHLDPAIPQAAADAVKRAWIESYTQGRRGDRLWAALAEGRPAGFLAALVTTHRDQPCAVLDLIGVGREYQGRGVGRALTAAFIRHYGACYAPEGVRLRVGTQAANIPSVRLYESLGFRLAETAYVLHWHVNRP